MMDSGANSSFLKHGELQELKCDKPSVSDAERRWSNASGGEVKLYGTSRVKFMNNQGALKAMNFKRSDGVSKTLASVPEICDKGHLIIFSKHGGAVISDTGEEIVREMMARHSSDIIPFRRE